MLSYFANRRKVAAKPRKKLPVMSGFSKSSASSDHIGSQKIPEWMAFDGELDVEVDDDNCDEEGVGIHSFNKEVMHM